MKKIQITETVLRDAHQSLMATRLKLEDFKDILPMIDKAGYRAVECWGGATFDSCLRFLDEDPWERLRVIKSELPNTKLQMLLRGQNLLGYKNYPDDVVEKFIELAIKNGIDIVRVFDALNDTRNLEVSIRAIKKYGAEAQVALSYTTSEVHTIEYFGNLAEELANMGADTICIKDMAGILLPQDAYDLVKEIKSRVDLPLEIHTHSTTGLGSMTYLKAVEAGADIIDTAISPFSGGTSQPPTETLNETLLNMGYETGLDIEVLQEIASHFEEVKTHYIEEGVMPVKMLTADPKGLIAQVPGGMLSNLYKQLEIQRQIDKYGDVLAEVPKVRAELGYPPLVTPMSQMVGTQATLNVLLGERYKMVPNEIKDYLKGEYGKAPAPIDDDFRRGIIGDSPVMEDRPADHLEDGLDKAKEEIGDLAKSEEDILSYALFPDQAKVFLKNRG